MKSQITRIIGLIHKAEDSLLVLVLGTLLLLASVDIFSRLVFGGGVLWIQPVLRIIVLWLGLLGAMVATRTREHISIDLVNRLAPDWIQRWVSVLTLGFSSAICGLIAWHSGAYVQLARDFGDTVMGDVPAWPMQLIIPICFGSMALRFGLQAVASVIFPPSPDHSHTQSSDSV